MKKEGITYTVQQVAAMVGISKQLLRKWEDRYHIIAPARLDNGYRVYSQADVTVLQNMKQLIDEGNSPQNAAQILNKLHTTTHTTQLALFQVGQTQSSQVVQQLLQLSRNAEDTTIVRLLQQAQLSMSMEQLLDEVIAPFLHQIVRYWETRICGEYELVVASLAVRDFLISLRTAIIPATGAPLIIGSCLPGERHEILLHILLIKCMLRGYQTLLLGPSPTPRVIQSAVMQKNPAIVLLTASSNEPFQTRLEDIKALEAFARQQPEVKFYVNSTVPITATVFDAIQVTHDWQDILNA